MNSIFFNKRIEGPFKETYKGYNQYIFTGDIDDLFLMDSSELGINRKLCRIEDAFAEYGKKEKYDIVITVKEDQNLSFGNSQQEELFNRLASGSSEKLVEEGKKAKAFTPRKKREEQSSASQSQTNENATNPNAQNSKRQVEEQAQGNDGLNRLNRITRVLQNTNTKTLVIYPNPEKMIVGGNVDAPTMQKIEVIVKKWRDIIQEANPETRTVLIINPHRLKEFRMVEHTLSCYDHNCKEITISNPPVDEMKTWLKKYRKENNIQGTKNDRDRVVLTGRANGGSLQNFISWVQGFFWTNPNLCNWSDLIAHENQDAVESVDGLIERLDEMIGLDDVKKEIKTIKENAEKNHDTAAEASYHMFFLGNPGTGKTVVADIVARLFWAMELRTSKKVVNVAIQDIISQYNEGETIQKMKDKVQEAMGGVLFIDEAYLFAESDWGRKAFQVLLTEMENNRNNLTVILAGYEERLQALKDVNPGIDNRIRIKLHFKDYSKEEKLRIFKLFLKKNNEEKETKYHLSPEAEQKLLRVLDSCEGNGRGVRNVFDYTLQKAGNAEEITENHIYDPHEIHPDEADKVIQDINREFIGMEDLKDRLKQYFKRIQWNVQRNKILGITKPSNYAYRIRFTGPPGTGKTSIARYMGRFFHAMGITETDGFQECGATSLKGAYVGHAQKAVNNLFHENRGKVIFIDEIYSLYNPDAHQDDSFSREVIDTLVRCLTAEEYQSTVVIVAGYKDRVDKFMEANPGLASRIPDEIEFQNYSANDCYKIFVAEAQKHQYEVLDGCQEKLEAYFQAEIDKNQSNFGNARDVKATFGLVETNVMNRVFSDSEMLSLAKTKPTREQFTQIIPEDIPAAAPIAKKNED
ncbi:AAA family ATPase [Fibrobacter sp. UWB13]|uniref:AAA family ATPase n=1 Tax=Fibrobacter sp. UWB13 TaxID=1896204 RepID=UPI000A09BA82|nr:AAA family ATPase [Fibrobacter sp. UWB13]SMG35471.1 AAA+-type ATPase, SpoVK/Ycf46/Vps4 family [Fibrobacter sp. UWB13]